MIIHTIGFTKKKAKDFFSKLKDAGVKRIIDVRLNNVSQLVGFSKKDDLAFFAKEILKADYIHEPELAPTQDLLDKYKKEGGDWAEYEKKFMALIKKRQIETEMNPKIFDHACLLCSEEKPHFCHRRLVAEYLRDKWKDVTISHIV